MKTKASYQSERFIVHRLMPDYKAGDITIHRACMIPTAATNQNPRSRMRLSIDIRYQRPRDEIDRRWQNHWSFDDML